MKTTDTNKKPSFSIPIPTFHLKAEDFILADESEKESLVVMRESVNFWMDGLRRLKKNKIAMTSFIVIVIVLIFAFILPEFYPYSYEQQIRGNENLYLMEYSANEQARMAAGEKIFPHFFGTDNLGRDMTIRLMYGARISLLVGIIASAIILLIGSTYGAIAAYFGGRVDMIMMRIVDMIYTVPDILIVILLMVTLKFPLKDLAERHPASFGWINVIGIGLISIFITFALLYWVGMSRIVRSQVLMLKEQDYVTAARAMGASSTKIITTHLLKNCIGILIITTTLQIPSSIFTESFLSFIGLGVSAPMPSLGSLAADAVGGMTSYPERLLAPSILISIIILSFNLLGDGLRDAFDPKLKN